MKTTENTLLANSAIPKTKATIKLRLTTFSSRKPHKNFAVITVNNAVAIATLKTFELLTNFSL